MNELTDEETGAAFQVIKQAMKKENTSEPGSYAHCWHVLIATACIDAMHDDEYANSHMHHEDRHRIANDAASRFMNICFDVETKG